MAAQIFKRVEACEGAVAEDALRLIGIAHDRLSAGRALRSNEEVQ
jgi:hypothetical protein